MSIKTDVGRAELQGRLWSVDAANWAELQEPYLEPAFRAGLDAVGVGDRTRLLDVGCGAGLLAEPLARLGATVTGIDASPEVIGIACDHAGGQGLAIDYREGDVQQLDGQFDLITCMEVIEHVAEPAAFLEALAKRLAPGGLLVMSTPNATSWSRLMMITIGEGLGQIPKGTHDFERFITPDRMKLLLADAGLRCLDVEGIAWSPARGLHLSEDVRLNYLVAAVRA